MCAHACYIFFILPYHFIILYYKIILRERNERYILSAIIEIIWKLLVFRNNYHGSIKFWLLRTPANVYEARVRNELNNQF